MIAPHHLIGGQAGSTSPPSPEPATPLAVPPPGRLEPSPLDVSTVRVLHDAVRASLRLGAGLDPGWTWPGHTDQEFLRAARGHHVCGLIAPHSAELGLPAELGEGITRHADRVAIKSLSHAALLRQVHRRLETAGIPALFFKGLATEAQTGRQLGDRGGGDIDVWVPPELVEAAIATLRPEWNLPDGYPQPGPSWAWRHWQRWGSELPLFGPITVDLHWHLHCVRANLPDFAEAWAARTEVLVGGRPVPTLGRRHALAHASRHAETDRWRILRSLVDIHLLLAPVGATPGMKPIALPGRSISVVDQFIGLPYGRTAHPLPARMGAAAIGEQLHVGSHADRIERLSRPAYLRRVLGRLSSDSRRPVHDALAMSWFLAVAPPHDSGGIATTSTASGVRHGVVRRLRYERDRARRDSSVRR